MKNAASLETAIPTCPKCGILMTSGRVGMRVRTFNCCTQEERFWAKVVKGDGCWTFTGAKEINGYGYISNKGGKPQYLLAHRYSWALANGPIPEGLAVMHSCDNPPCVNPAHLSIGTWKDNARDKVTKGRDPGALLTPEQVREIRVALTAPYRGLQRALAKKYGVHSTVISCVNTGKNYQWVK